MTCGSLRGAAAVLYLIKYKNSFSDKLHQQVIVAVQWGYSDSRSPCDKPIICCGQYMAVSKPGHGDLTALMSRMASIFDALGANCIGSSRGRALCANYGRMENMLYASIGSTQENRRK